MKTEIKERKKKERKKEKKERKKGVVNKDLKNDINICMNENIKKKRTNNDEVR